MLYEDVYGNRMIDIRTMSTLKTLLGVAAIGAGIFAIARGYLGLKTLQAVGKGVGRLARKDITLTRERFPFLYYGRESSRPLHFRLLGKRSLGWHSLLP